MSSPNYVAHVQRSDLEDGTPAWEAWHPALPGCRSQGRTAALAVDSLHEARRLYLQALEESRIPFPESDTNVKGTVIVYVH